MQGTKELLHLEITNLFLKYGLERHLRTVEHITIPGTIQNLIFNVGPRSHVKSALHFPLICMCVCVCVCVRVCACACVLILNLMQVFSDILIMGIYAIN